MAVDREELVASLNQYLDLDAVEDASLNGLQLEGASRIEHLAVAVDAAQATIEGAIDAGCQFLLVHHGLFWGTPAPLAGPLASRVRACFAAEMSVYAAHLPLDRHPEVGNNVLLAKALGGSVTGEFGRVGGVALGALAQLDEPCEIGALAGRLAAAGCREPLLWSFGPPAIERLAVVTGAGCSLLEEAVAMAADCFVTGEPRHSAFHIARERHIHCLFGGHYATETFGVRALGAWLGQRYDLEVNWIDHPTGV
ncbi:MAG: Nif3-like dinuclear metal center hexameric protein [Acidobacteriota bacterium]